LWLFKNNGLNQHHRHAAGEWDWLLLRFSWSFRRLLYECVSNTCWMTCDEMKNSLINKSELNCDKPSEKPKRNVKT
jgi:hypothetical protein